ncbi:hypothetical protein ES705_45301 [subsurface metagenome]
MKEEKTQEEKAKEEKTKVEKEREEKAQEEKIKEEKAQEEKTKEEKAKEEKAREEKTKEEKIKVEKEREEKAREEMKREQAARTTVSDTSSKHVYEPAATTLESRKKRNSKRNIIIWVVLILLINAILITGYFMYNKDLPAFFRKAEVEELPIDEPVIIEEDNYVTESYEDVTTTPDTKGEAPEEEIRTEDIPHATPIRQGPKYYIVAGSFSYEDNADNLVKDLKQKGYNAEKFGSIGNLHAVSYDVFSTRQEADRFLKTIQTELDPQAWIKKVD